MLWAECLCHTRNPYAKVLTPKVMALRGRAFGRWSGNRLGSCQWLHTPLFVRRPGPVRQWHWVRGSLTFNFSGSISLAISSFLISAIVRGPFLSLWALKPWLESRSSKSAAFCFPSAIQFLKILFLLLSRISYHYLKGFRIFKVLFHSLIAMTLTNAL